MDIRSKIEQFIFRIRGFKKNQEPTPPLGKRYYIDASNITLGNPPWKGRAWDRVYQWGYDPMFRWHLPWDDNHGVKNNIIIEDDRIRLRMHGHKHSKEAYLYSNFTIKTGTVRAMIKTPNIEGAWSAFWLMGKFGMPEIDIFEHCGEWTDKVNVTHHWGYDYENINGKKSTLSNGRQYKDFRPTEKYNLYEVELTPYKVIYKINNTVVRTMKRGVPSGPNHVIFDIVKGTYCGSGPTSELDDDAYMDIKYLELFIIE